MSGGAGLGARKKSIRSAMEDRRVAEEEKRGGYALSHERRRDCVRHFPSGWDVDGLYDR